MPWVCKLCGREIEAETAPELCPSCGGDSASFKSREATADAAAGATGNSSSAPGQPTDSPPSPDQPADECQCLTRRRFFQVTGLVAGAGLVGAASYTTWQFLQPAAPLEARTSFTLDAPANYPEGRTFVKDAKAFIERRGDRLRCVSAVCTHLGCIITWDAAVENFHCPCHGSRFSPDGQVTVGPATRPLPFYQLTLGGDGKLVLDTKRHPPSGDASWLKFG